MGGISRRLRRGVCPVNLRLAPGMIRVRLSRTELDTLLEHGEVSAATAFAPDWIFTYAVALDDDAPGLVLDIAVRGLRLRLPKAQARALAARVPSKEGLNANQADGCGGMLALNLEVDLHASRREGA